MKKRTKKELKELFTVLLTAVAILFIVLIPVFLYQK
jgi:hypothetical protein